jgi:hypothetical protein
MAKDGRIQMKNITNGFDTLPVDVDRTVFPAVHGRTIHADRPGHIRLAHIKFFPTVSDQFSDSQFDYLLMCCLGTSYHMLRRNAKKLFIYA